MTESKYQKKLIDQYTKQGYLVIKMIKTNIVGIPDLLLLKAGEIPIFIEVKGPNGRASKIQEYRIKQLIDMGFLARIDKCS